jgi:hypothetical protein
VETYEFKTGQTIHCWEPGKNYMAHRFIVYLGKDKNADDNVLVHSKQYGWDIISLSEISKDKYRFLGDFNIMELMTDSKKKVNGLVYRFHDNKESILITVKLLRGVWKIKQDFQTPSWVQKGGADAGGARS